MSKVFSGGANHCPLVMGRDISGPVSSHGGSSPDAAELNPPARPPRLPSMSVACPIPGAGPGCFDRCQRPGPAAPAAPLMKPALPHHGRLRIRRTSPRQTPPQQSSRSPPSTATSTSARLPGTQRSRSLFTLAELATTTLLPPPVADLLPRPPGNWPHCRIYASTVNAPSL